MHTLKINTYLTLKTRFPTISGKQSPQIFPGASKQASGQKDGNCITINFEEKT